jgi:hypothetical protein
VPKPTFRPEASVESHQVQQQMQRSSEARAVDNSLTPAPEVAFAFPSDFDVPILAPDSADPAELPTDASYPRPPADGAAHTREGYEHPSTLGPSDPTPRPPVTSTSEQEREVSIPTPPSVSTPPPQPSRSSSSVPPVGSRTPPPRMPPPSTRSSSSQPDRIVPNIPDAPTERATLPHAQAPNVRQPPDTSDLALSTPPDITDDVPRKVSRPDDSGPQEPLLGQTPKKKKKPKAEIPAGILRSGKLEDAPAALVLRRLVDGGATGIVEFRCGLIWKRVLISAGTPTGITSNMGMELIGEHLVKARKISRESLDRALSASEGKGRSLTMTLIEQGAIDRNTLEEELGRNLSARLQEVLEWRWGTFEYRDEPIDDNDILPKLDLDALLARASEPDHETTDTSDASAAAQGSNAQSQLKEALRVARSISKSTGKGRVERPWRNSKP